MSENAKTHKFQAEVSQVLSLVINSLYSNKEIFLRELVSNASDALDKLRFESIAKPELLGDSAGLEVRIVPDAEGKTLSIWDNGIGMSEEELIQNLGTVAHSGTQAFLEQLEKSKDVNLIGQFGVGFYSAYLVADKVEVVSRAAGSDKAFRWVSEAKDTFSVEPAEREEAGTTLILHLKEEQQDFLETYRLRSLIRRYSDFVSHPIKLQVEKTTQPEGDDEDAEPIKSLEFEVINKGKPVWEQPPSEVTDEQYQEFYKHLTHDWEPALTHAHFKIEGTQLFTGLIFIPKRPPFDLFDANSRHGVRLYVKRVFIMDDCEELLPKWLRFAKGVIDSDDLPLNVSREILQDSKTVRTIRKQVIKKTLDALKKLATDDADAYNEFWSKFGAVLKEGLHFDPEHKGRLAKLLRFESSQGEGWTSLDEYIERMPEGQEAIYYIQGNDREQLEKSPHLEVLKKKGYEVLYMTDAIDHWATTGLGEYDDKKLVSAQDADLKLNDDESEEEAQERAEAFKGLTERIQSTLDSLVREVRVSTRLVDSPVCLVLPEGAAAAHIERMLRANNQYVPKTKRIMEINPNHALIRNLNEYLEGKNEDEAGKWIHLLYDQALIGEGSPVEDPAGFATRMTDLMSGALTHSATKS